MEEHTADFRNVREGDSVTIHTTRGESFDVECERFEKEQADPRSGEVRETRIWTLVGDSRTLTVAIVDGLRSSESDPDFPIHHPIFEVESEAGIGYVESLDLHGKMEA